MNTVAKRASNRQLGFSGCFGISPAMVHFRKSFGWCGNRRHGVGQKPRRVDESGIAVVDTAAVARVSVVSSVREMSRVVTPFIRWKCGRTRNCR